MMPRHVDKRLTYPQNAWLRYRSMSGKPNDERSESEIDRSRILHSAAFRRLAGKTQIFGLGQDSFFRSRLTHSLEVAQIAKGIALRVGADPEACEASALAHDIGHPPYGHSGEVELAKLMHGHGGFEANAQNFRILTELEVKFSNEPGLNLTRTVLDSLLKYRAPWPGVNGKFYYGDDGRVKTIVEWAKQSFDDKSFECQIMDWADDIAYSCHDLEDGLHAGMISSQMVQVFANSILAHAQRKISACTEADWDEVLKVVVECEAAGDPKKAEAARKMRISALINEFVQVRRSKRTHAGAAVTVPLRHRFDLSVPTSLRRKCQMLKSAAYILLVNDARVASLEKRAGHVLPQLFDLYRAENAAALYPEPFRSRFERATHDDDRARVACDFISGMTDDYAERVYSRVFSGNRAALADY